MRFLLRPKDAAGRNIFPIGVGLIDLFSTLPGTLAATACDSMLTNPWGDAAIPLLTRARGFAIVAPMSIWTRIADALSALAAGEGLFAVFDRLRSTPENSVGFTIAVIALGAKMAKADGTVTRDEVTAFRRVFTIPEGEEDHAAHVFNLARQDVAGFDAYARKIRRMFRDENRALLADLVETLFHIAMADGRYHDLEDDFLDHVAEIFGLTEAEFSAIRARYVDGAPQDPFTVLGLTEDAALEEAHAAWKQAVRDNHPDRLIARGLPPEAISLAERRLIAINAAWDQIQMRRAA